MPAQLTNPSIFLISFKLFLISSVFVQLISFTIHLFFNFNFNLSRDFFSLSIAIIVAPSLARSIAAALPIPFAAPVTAIIFF